MMTNICTFCGHDHSDQIRDFPQGTIITVVNEFRGGIELQKYDPFKPLDEQGDVYFNITVGSTGEVIAHTEDGRAVFVFNINGINTSHTFHAPCDYFNKPLKKYGYLDAMNDIADVQLIDNTIAEAEIVRAELTKIIKVLCGIE
jgi:hypothetical protein